MANLACDPRKGHPPVGGGGGGSEVAVAGGLEEGLGHLGPVGEGVHDDVDLPEVLLHLRSRVGGFWWGEKRRRIGPWECWHPPHGTKNQCINMGRPPSARPYLLGDLRDGVAREAGVPLVGLHRLGHVIGGVVHGVEGVDLLLVVVVRTFIYLFVCSWHSGIWKGEVWSISQSLTIGQD